MATQDKDFKVKNGLIVGNSTNLVNYTSASPSNPFIGQLWIDLDEDFPIDDPSSYLTSACATALYMPISASSNYLPMAASANYLTISASSNYLPMAASANYLTISASSNYLPMTASANYLTISASSNYLQVSNASVTYALLNSPTFTGTPLAPTAASGTNTTQIATTAFVNTAITNLINGAPGALDTLDELAAALGDDANYASTVTTALNNRVLKTGGDTITVSSGTTVPLTIQNNGTGNSFVVNDVASDTTPFVIDASGNVGIGQSSPQNLLDVSGIISSRNTNEWNIRSVSTGTTSTNRNHFIAQRANGFSAVTNGFNLGGLAVGGFDGTNYSFGWNGGVEITAYATETWTSTARGTSVAISTTANGSNSSTERLRIDSSGNVGIGITGPSYKLDVPFTVRLGGTSSNQGQGAIINGTINAQTTANWNYSGVDFVRNASNVSQARLIGMPLGGDDIASTTVGGYNAIWGFYDSAPGSTSTSSALNGVMGYAAYSGHRWFNNGTEYMRIESGGKVAVKGTAVNTGPARLELQSQGDTSSFYHKEVFRVSVNDSATEISRLTTTGANGFRAYFKIILTGHNGTLGNATNIKEYYWDGGTSAPVQISTYTQGTTTTISFDNSTSNVCIVKLAAASANGFQGTMMIEWLMPRDYSGNTGVIS